MQFLRGSNFFTLILCAFTPLTLVASNILLSYLSTKEIENMHSLLLFYLMQFMTTVI